MPFPTIRHINDVLPAIQGRDEFTVGARDGYQFIDYNYAGSDTFDCPIRRECRGLKFDMDGKLIARPFHKFFNLHEKPSEVPTLSGDNHTIMEKLDGSMIHPARVNGELVFMTRAGITDQALAAMDACKRLPYGGFLLDYCALCIEAGLTPIFEYTAPSNQIVIRYSEEALTLIAVRWTKTGNYWPAKSLEITRDDWMFPIVRTFDPTYNLDEFVTYAKSLTDTEGFVIRCGDWMGKVKADAYVASHRAKSGLLWEKDVLRLVLEQKVDDVAGLLPKADADALIQWADKVTERLDIYGRLVYSVVDAAPKYTRLSESRGMFADYLKRNMHSPAFMSWAFSVYSGKTPYNVIRDYGLKQTASTAKARTFLDIIGVTDAWVPTRVEVDA